MQDGLISHNINSIRHQMYVYSETSDVERNKVSAKVWLETVQRHTKCILVSSICKKVKLNGLTYRCIHEGHIQVAAMPYWNVVDGKDKV